MDIPRNVPEFLWRPRVIEGYDGKSLAWFVHELPSQSFRDAQNLADIAVGMVLPPESLSPIFEFFSGCPCPLALPCPVAVLVRYALGESLGQGGLPEAGQLVFH